MAELAVALDEPGADLLLLAWFEDLMGEGAGRACGAGADFEKFARDMGEVLGWGVARKGAGVRRRGTVGVGRTYPWRKASALGPCLSRGLCLCRPHPGLSRGWTRGLCAWRLRRAFWVGELVDAGYWVGC